MITVFERQEALRGYTISAHDLRKLLKRLFELEEESHRRELYRLKERSDLSEEDKAKIEPVIRRAHTLWTSVHGTNGEHFFANAATNLPEDQLPKEITRVPTGNINPYRSILNREPSEGFQVMLDFSRPPFLDWNNPVSSPTVNDSSVLAKGDQVWTGAVVKCVEDELRSCRNRRQFFHRPFAYDLGLVDREESRFQAGLSSGSAVRAARIWRNKCLSQRIRRRKLQPAAASTGLAASPSRPAR